MQQRVQFFHRRDSPSSTTQLPIMAALHAEKLTLFVAILQDVIGKVKPLLINLYQMYKNAFPGQPGERKRGHFSAERGGSPMESGSSQTKVCAKKPTERTIS